MDSNYAFITDIAAHLDGWTLQTDEQKFTQTRRAGFVSDSDPYTVIIAVPPQWNRPDRWGFHVGGPTVSRQHVSLPEVPKGIHAAATRSPESVARDILRKLAPRAVDYARDVAERLAAHHRRVAVSDAALTQIGELLPQARLNFGPIGSAEVHHRTGEWESIWANFRLDHGTVCIRGLSPAQQVAVATALADILAQAPTFDPGGE